MDEIPDLVEELPPDFAVQESHLATVKTSGENESKPTKKIPITIITGYLGSGKSTLLERIGKLSNKRLAIILNEFGDTAAIEKSVTIQDNDRAAVEEWLDLGNGCLCCTVKDNGVLAIENLVEKSKHKIDYILLETTGVADPAPIAKMFWLDDALSSSVYIDGVVTVVDSANITTCLDDVGGHWHRENNHVDENEESSKNEGNKALLEGITTAHLQIALADCILLNKIDRIDSEEADKIEKRLRQINSSSPIHRTSFGDVSLDKILDLHAFEATSEKVASSISVATDSRYHDDRVKTAAIEFPFFENPDGFSRVERFLQNVLWENKVGEKPVEIHRAKGVLVCGNDVRVVQGVRDTYDVIENGTLHESIKCNKLVFIGKGFERADLESELEKYLKN